MANMSKTTRTVAGDFKRAAAQANKRKDYACETGDARDVKYAY